MAGTICPESARQGIGRSDQPKQTHTPADRTAGRPDSATAGQYSAGVDDNWPDSAVTTDHGRAVTVQTAMRCSG